MDSTQLATLLEVTRTARDAAAKRVAHLEHQVQQARDHLQTLLGYSSDYAGRLQARAGDELDPAAQANQRAFLGKLRIALEAQQREVEAREQASVAARADLAVCQRKVKSLETLAQRRAQEQAQHEARREQRHTDEVAQRSVLQFGSRS